MSLLPLLMIEEVAGSPVSSLLNCPDCFQMVVVVGEVLVIGEATYNDCLTLPTPHTACVSISIKSQVFCWITGDEKIALSYTGHLSLTYHYFYNNRVKHYIVGFEISTCGFGGNKYVCQEMFLTWWPSVAYLWLCNCVTV